MPTSSHNLPNVANSTDGNVDVDADINVDADTNVRRRLRKNCFDENSLLHVEKNLFGAKKV